MGAVDDHGATLADRSAGVAIAATPAQTGKRAPRITEIEVDAVRGGRLRLEAETSGRTTSVRFTYRGRTYKARRTTDGDWARTVKARGGDRDDRVVRLEVRACNGSRCTTKTGRDDA